MKKSTLLQYGFVIMVLMITSCKEKTEQMEPEIPVEVNYLEESKEDFDNRMQWWREDRFGMFIHWGVYAVPAGEYKGVNVDGIGEWIQQRGQIPKEDYEVFASQFNPVKFDADVWVKILKEAGMKYLVITSKHHDGFALWDSKVSDYNIVDFAPYGKDVLKALSTACKKQGIKFGLYHSIMDWHHTDAQAFSYLKEDPRKREDNTAQFENYLETYMKPQIKELIDNYDPDILWFDGEWVGEFSHDQGLELYQYVRSLKPNILINNRVDKGRQGMQGMNKEDGVYAGDFGTPEQEILENASTLDWESCMTMNDTWGFKKNDHNWKSATLLVHNLIDVAAKGGNYLLNVGPTAEGLIPEPSVIRLEAMGRWLSINGEAIYNTEKLSHNFKLGDEIRYTKKTGKNTFYGISLIKPEKEIKFNFLRPETDSQIFMLGYDKPLKWTSKEDGLYINIPEDATKTSSEAWVFKITGVEI